MWADWARKAAGAAAGGNQTAAAAAAAASVLDPPFGLSLGGWNACRTLQENIMLNNKLSQLSRG